MLTIVTVTVRNIIIKGEEIINVFGERFGFDYFKEE